MRLASKWILLAPLSALCCPALPQASQQPTITIDSKSAAVKSGEPIHVHIVLKNTTDREFTIFRSVGGGRGEQYYSISVIDPGGNPAAPTEYGAAARKQQAVPGSRIMKTIAPGADVAEYVFINEMFDMTGAGTYVVQVSRASPFDPTVILKSNTLAITVSN